MINAKHRQVREEDPEFMPFPKEHDDKDGGADDAGPAGRDNGWGWGVAEHAN